MTAQSMPQMVDQVEQARTQHFSIADVATESGFGADRLRLSVGDDSSVVVSVGQSPKPAAHRSKVVQHDRFGQSRELADGVQSEGMKPLFPFLAAETGQRCGESATIRPMTTGPSGFW